MRAGFPAEKMLVELEFLVCARSFEKLRFEACCELVASGRLAGDWREIETFVLSARDSMVSPPVLFEKLPTSRSQALVAAMGVVAEGVSRGRVTTAVTMREMMEVLAAVAGKEKRLAGEVFGSMRRGAAGGAVGGGSGGVGGGGG